MTGTDTRTAGTPVPAVTAGRRIAVLAAALAGLLLANLAIYALGRALGGGFTYRQNGVDVPVEPVAITLLSLGPLLTGLAIAAVVARWWPRIITLARIAGPVFAVATIGVMTLPADFDTTSTVCLAAMHLATIPALLVALNALPQGRTGWRPHP